jgi:hypothetical protein
LFAEISQPIDVTDSAAWRESNDMAESLENMRRFLGR